MVVVDSNIVIASTVEIAYSDQARELLGIWTDEDVAVFVPQLWRYEVVTALRKFVAADLIKQEKALILVETLFSMNIEVLPDTVERHQQALRWAEKLDQYIAYDAQYLALAEELGAEFWSADKGLVMAARQAGAEWARWLGEG
jgi:predicted nucleic acid-binding protein